ncbi:MAG: Bax inhibitor-1/YccA family protein [Bauldia sp.]|nr:Bax inhibitor-1/YccA family protein [Bauldia sp.]MCW5719471.1 Bax inhibitor-1/YccA family protein [Bauldia sp.]
MADFRTPTTRYGTAAPAASVGEMDLGLRAYMLRVYNYMVVGLAITGVVSLLTYNLATTTDPAQAAGQVGSTLLTSLGVTLYGSPLQWVIIFAPLVLVIFLSVRIARMSVASAQIAFWAFAALLGLSLSSIFLVYTSQSIAQVFFITAATFGAVSLWGYTTKRDLTGWGSFLFMGLIGVIIASIVNIFLGSDALGFAISIIGVLVFTGLTAYDTQKIKEMYSANDDGTLMGRKAIMGALRLYLDFINLFLMLLRLFGNRE